VIPKCLRPEIVPYTSVEIIIAGLLVAAPVVPTICAWCPDFDPTHPANRRATHVMCPACRERFEQVVA
jgi:hypothetical protein